MKLLFRIPKADLLVFILLTLVYSCDKNKNEIELPALSNEGANTFGCYINSEPFVANGSSSINGPQALSGSYNESTYLLKIEGIRESENDELEQIKFRAYLNSGVGSYSIEVLSDTQIGYQDFSGNSGTYYHNPNSPGSLQITYLSTNEKIVSGKFEMNLINPTIQDSIMEITDGRFDFKYEY